MKVSRKIIMAAKLILVSMLFSACGNKNQDLKSVKAKTEIEQEIVFVQQYTNYSDTYINKGFFIDNKGNKIEYDLSAKDKKYADGKELLAYLEKLRYETSESAISMEDLTRYYELLYKINLDYKVKEESTGADQGRDALYGVVYNADQSPVMILIEEKGDWNRKNMDPNAVKIRKELR